MVDIDKCQLLLDASRRLSMATGRLVQSVMLLNKYPHSTKCQANHRRALEEYRDAHTGYLTSVNLSEVNQ